MIYYANTRYYTVAHAARLCGVPTRTVQRWAADGRLTSHDDQWPLLVDLLEVEQLAQMRDTRQRLPRLTKTG